MSVFRRSKFVVSDKAGAGLLQVRAVLMDTVHEMEVNLTVDMNSMTIIRAHSAMTRAPYSFCLDIAGSAQRLAGFNIDEKNTVRRLRSLVGGSEGCFQLEDLALEAIKVVYQSTHAYLEGGKKEILELFDRQLRGTCYGHCHTLEEKLAASITPGKL